MKIILPESQIDQTPTWIENWHNGNYGYCVQLMTEEGFQVGDAFYGSKESALMTEKDWEGQYNIDHTYSMKKRKEYRKRIKSK
ncbi:hypothetical protein ACFQZE_07165 [Paenibacillus sp. GCM10027627]|uniref:hypothetical protein n=1 Tax=unclassified Paenibacillus TaxID=185978 RepID=UPI00362BBF3E